MGDFDDFRCNLEVIWIQLLNIIDHFLMIFMIFMIFYPSLFFQDLNVMWLSLEYWSTKTEDFRNWVGRGDCKALSNKGNASKRHTGSNCSKGADSVIQRYRITHRIVQLVFLIRLHWIAIYPMDSAIHLLNNRGLKYIKISDEHQFTESNDTYLRL